jgi:hypothetical protein
MRFLPFTGRPVLHDDTRRAGRINLEPRSIPEPGLVHDAATSTTARKGSRMQRPAPIRHDTRAWQAQVWISFGIAASLAAIGLAYLPGQDLDRAFMFMGYGFCLSAAFVLAKYVRDREVQRSDTPMFGAVVWGGFALAMALTAWGLWRMQISPTYKAFLGVCWLYLISSVFSLAKTLRDAHEARLAERLRHAHPAATDDN